MSNGGTPIANKAIAGKMGTLPVQPCLKIEPDALFGIVIDIVVVTCSIEVLGPETHNGVCALLKVLFSDGDIQHGKLRFLVAFGVIIIKVYGTIFFQPDVSQPGSKSRCSGRYPVKAGRHRDGADGGIRIGGLGGQATGRERRENYYRCGRKETAAVRLHVVNLKIAGRKPARYYSIKKIVKTYVEYPDHR